MKAATPLDSRADPGLQAALTHLNAGRNADAVQACEAVLGRDGRHAPALHLLGVAQLRLGRAGAAREALEAAAAIAPASLAIQLTLGDARHAAGDPNGALRSYEAACELAPDNGAAVLRLAAALDYLGDSAGAARILHGRVRAAPLDFAAAQAFVDQLARQARAQPEATSGEAAVVADAAIASVSVGMCSVDPRRAEAAMRSLSRALASTPCDFHIVNDARSLSEGFNRIVNAARGEVLILCHDDIELLSPRLDLALAEALRGVDIVGVAGARRVSGPAVLWAGHPHVHGWVTYPRGGELEAAPLSFECGVLQGMQSLDGVFMAMRRESLGELRFDERTFDGFHFYDLDFSFRAHLAGLRLGVSTDILLAHASEGQFAEDWKRYAARFLAKFPDLAAAQGEPHWYGARFDTRERVLAFYEMIRGHARAEPHHD